MTYNKKKDIVRKRRALRWKEGYNLDYLIEYDESNPISIEKYAQRLIGKTFADVCNQDDLDKSIVVHETSDYETSHENKKRKGGLGEIIEERFFHYQLIMTLDLIFIRLV